MYVLGCGTRDAAAMHEHLVMTLFNQGTLFVHVVLSYPLNDALYLQRVGKAV